MNQTTVLNKINDLGYQGIKEAYLRQIEDTNYTKLSFEERLYNLLEAQEIFLLNKKIVANLKASKIKNKSAAVEDIDYSARRKIDRQTLQALITMDFIRNHQNIIITGKTGTGKSFISQALGIRAIYDGFKVFYIRVPTLLEEIKIARAAGTYTNLLRKYSRFQLLILDDFGISPMSVDDTVNLLEIIEAKADINSIIITSQLPVSQWYEYLNNKTAADAMLDRVVHSHRIELEGESMRKLMSKIN